MRRWLEAFLSRLSGFILHILVGATDLYWLAHWAAMEPEKE